VFTFGRDQKLPAIVARCGLRKRGTKGSKSYFTGKAEMTLGSEGLGPAPRAQGLPKEQRGSPITTFCQLNMGMDK
jgi:hypothetical protein